MDDGCAWDKNWWRKAKAASLERRRLQRPVHTLANPGDAFLIVTEGTVTEPIYFDLLRGDLQLPAVRIKVQPGDASDPRHVIETAAQEAKEQERKGKRSLLALTEPVKFDQVWAVIDTDVAVRQNFWSDVQQLASARKIRLAHSTPCFEYWLLLHITGLTTRADLVDGSAAKRAVKSAFGGEYSTNEAVAQQAIKTFILKWPEAVLHAEHVRRHHEQAATPIPANPSTEVDQLVRALNDSAPEHVRRLQP